IARRNSRAVRSAGNARRFGQAKPTAAKRQRRPDERLNRPSSTEPELLLKTTIKRCAAAQSWSSSMRLTTMAIANIKPNPRNARTHGAKQERQIEHSIEAFGWTNPLLIDEHGMVIAGHGRLAAAINLKMTEVPVLVLEGLSEKKKAALALADNRIALNAGWDLEILADELRELSTPELDFDLE